MDYNNKPEQNFGGNDNIFDNNQNFGNPGTTNGAPVYNAPNTTPGNGVYTPNPAPVNNTYGGGNNYYSNPTPPGDFDRFSTFGGEKETPVTLGDWMLTYLIMMIPCVNVIMMFVWAFSSGTKKSKSNYFKATLIWMLIVIVLEVILILAMGGLGAMLAETSSYSYY